jgi:hypothetical protein
LAAALDRVAEPKIAERWRLFGLECDERRRRLWGASEAKTHGPGACVAGRVRRRPWRRIGSPPEKCDQLEEVSPVRGLESTSLQLSLRVDDDGMARVWAAMSAQAHERVLRLLACVIGRVVTGEEEGDQ